MFTTGRTHNDSTLMHCDRQAAPQGLNQTGVGKMAPTSWVRARMCHCLIVCRVRGQRPPCPACRALKNYSGGTGDDHAAAIGATTRLEALVFHDRNLRGRYPVPRVHHPSLDCISVITASKHPVVRHVICLASSDRRSRQANLVMSRAYGDVPAASWSRTCSRLTAHHWAPQRPVPPGPERRPSRARGDQLRPIAVRDSHRQLRLTVNLIAFYHPTAGATLGDWTAKF